MPYCSVAKYSTEDCSLFVMRENYLAAVSSGVERVVMDKLSDLGFTLTVLFGVKGRF